MAAKDDDALFRAIGRLEGHFSALETRVTTMDSTTDRRLNAVAAKLDSISETINVLQGAIRDARSEQETETEKFSFGWKIMTIMAAIFVGSVSLLLNIYVALYK